MVMVTEEPTWITSSYSAILHMTFAELRVRCDLETLRYNAEINKPPTTLAAQSGFPTLESAQAWAMQAYNALLWDEYERLRRLRGGV